MDNSSGGWYGEKEPPKRKNRGRKRRHCSSRRGAGGRSAAAGAIGAMAPSNREEDDGGALRDWAARLRRREAELEDREAALEDREAAVARDIERAKALVQEFGAASSSGADDAVFRVSRLTTDYVREVLRALWVAGRPDAAAAMCAAFDGAPSTLLLGQPAKEDGGCESEPDYGSD